MPRLLPSTAALIATLLAAPFATASPDPGQLDRRRDALLDEMAGHLARWKPQPAAPTPKAPAAAAPADAVTDDGADGIDETGEPSDGILDGSDDISNSQKGMPDGMADGMADDSDDIRDGRSAVAANDPVVEPALPVAPPIEPAPLPSAPELPPPAALPEPAAEATEPAEPVADAASDDAAASADAPIPLGRHDARLIAAAVLDETNAARARHGLPPVEPSPILEAAAVEFAGHLARTGQFGHIDLTRAGMEQPGDRVRAAGGKDVLAAENLITETWLQVDGGEQMFVVDEARYRFSRTPGGPIIPAHTPRTLARSMVQRWLDSPGHRRNILDAEGKQMGFGMAWDPRAQIPSLVAVQVFQRYHRLGEGPDLKR